MKFFVCNEETDNKGVLLEKSAWNGKSNLYINGKKLLNLKKNVFLYKENENSEIEVYLKGNEIFGIEINMHDRSIVILRKLNIFEIILTLIPIALIFIGGAIGGTCAAVGMITIATFCRKIDNIVAKTVFSISIYVVITLIWYVIASLILGVF